MEAEGRDMRRLATQALQAEVKEALEQDAPEALQAQSHALSNGRRTLPTAQVRAAMAEAFNLGNLVEWASKDRAGGYQIILQRGEPRSQCQNSHQRVLKKAKAVMAARNRPGARPDKGQIKKFKRCSDKLDPT